MKNRDYWVLIWFFNFFCAGLIFGYHFINYYHYTEVASGEVVCELAEQEDLTTKWVCERKDSD